MHISWSIVINIAGKYHAIRAALAADLLTPKPGCGSVAMFGNVGTRQHRGVRPKGKPKRVKEDACGVYWSGRW